MVGLENGHIHKNLTQNGKSQRSSWGAQKKKKKKKKRRRRRRRKKKKKKKKKRKKKKKKKKWKICTRFNSKERHSIRDNLYG